jgi:predicted ATPase
VATAQRGWALSAQGHEQEGLALVRQGVAGLEATGSLIARSYHLALLAEACGNGGQFEEGFTLLAEALATVDKTGERYYEAELYRLKGELLLHAERNLQQDERHTKKKRRESSPPR